MSDIAISTGDFIKDLGVIFQKDLKFDEHICKVYSTANSRLGIIKSVFHYVDKEGFLILYKSLVRPILEYCNVVWSPYLKKHHKKIEQIQRRGTRMIRGLRDLSYSDRLKSLNLTTLYYRRRRSDVIQVFRIISKIDSITFEDFFKFDTGITRGNNMKLIKPRASTSMMLNSFSHRIINDWNDLPNDVVLSTSLNMFKSNLNKYWSTKSFKFVFDF